MAEAEKLDDKTMSVSEYLADLQKTITETEKYRTKQKKLVKRFHQQMNAVIGKDHNERDMAEALDKLEGELGHKIVHSGEEWDDGVTFKIDDKESGHETRVHTVSHAPNVVRITEIFTAPEQKECQFKIYIGSGEGCKHGEGMEICTVGGDREPCSECENINFDLEAMKKWTAGAAEEQEGRHGTNMKSSDFTKTLYNEVVNNFASSARKTCTGVVLTLVPSISSTSDWMSLSVILLMWPFLTFLSQICKGLLPILYRMDRNPLWNIFLNIFAIYYSGKLTDRKFAHKLYKAFIA